MKTKLACTVSVVIAALTLGAVETAHSAETYRLESTLTWPVWFPIPNCDHDHNVVIDSADPTVWGFLKPAVFGINQYPWDPSPGVNHYSRVVGPTMGTRNAEFSSALLRVGTNAIEYWDGPQLTICHYLETVIRLHRPGRMPLLLASNSWGALPIPGGPDLNLGNSSIKQTLSLQFDPGGPAKDWVDPVLAQQIRELFDEIDWFQQRCVNSTLCGEADRGLNDMAAVEAMRAEVEELISRDLDDIDLATLDALIAKYGKLASVLEYLIRPVLASIKMKIEDLRREIETASRALNDQIAQLADLAGIGTAGDPRNPSGFTPLTDTGALPPVRLPPGFDLPFSEEHDPYKAYADTVLADLASHVGNAGVVFNRHAVSVLFDTWRTNQHLLDEWIRHRGALVPTKEAASHVRQKQRVLSEFTRHLSTRGWFHDCAVPGIARDLIDFDIAIWHKSRARALKLELNQWRGTLNEKQQRILDFLLLVDALHKSGLTASDPVEADKFSTLGGKLLEGLVDFAKGAAVLAVGFTPLGDFLDACELITGWDGCNWSGRRLTTIERVLSGAGIFVIGSTRLIRKAAEKMTGVRKIVTDADEMIHDLKPRTPKKGIIKTIPDPPNPFGKNTVFVHESGIEIKFNEHGFPDFSKYLHQGAANTENTVRIKLTGEHVADSKLANKAANLSETPELYTWHHNEDVGTMQLIQKDVHKLFAHNGGFAIWKRVTSGVYEIVDE